jgi:hypothetical protein
VGSLLLRDENRRHLLRFRTQRGGILSDPTFEQQQFRLGKRFAALGHFTGSGEFEESAFFRLTGDHYIAPFGSVEHETAEAQVDAALGFLAFAVTLEAMRLEDGADVPFKNGVFGQGTVGREGSEREVQEAADEEQGAGHA